MSQFPVEPWNTASNIVFLLIIGYFFFRTRPDRRRHRLLLSALPLLAVGFIGGTLFHSMRTSNVWLVMDYMSIYLLAITASICLWRGIIGNWIAPIVLLTILFELQGRIVPLLGLSKMAAISIGYAVLASVLIAPAIEHCRRNGWRNVYLLVGSLILIGFALSFRMLDATRGRDLLPMGTHFLWHLFGGASVFCFMTYLLRAGTSSILGCHEERATTQTIDASTTSPPSFSPRA